MTTKFIPAFTEKNANLFTNWFAGLAGVPQIINGLGLANVSLVPVNDGYHLAMTWMPNAFDIGTLLSGLSTLVIGYLLFKRPKL